MRIRRILASRLTLALLPLALFACALPACAGRVRGPVVQSYIELALDEGRAAERPLTPPQTFELLMRFDPKLPAYRLLHLRVLVAQPGQIVYTFYAVDEYGRPGAAQKSLARYYGPETISSGDDGKWVMEDLSEVPVQRGPVFVGISCPEKNSDPRLWAASNDSGNVFQRDADPSLTLDQMRIKRTPVLRLSVAAAE